MERRHFLKGIVASAVGSTLIVEASPEDVARFGKADPLVAEKASARSDDRIYDRYGRAIGRVMIAQILVPGSGYVDWRVEHDIQVVMKSSPHSGCDHHVGIVRFFEEAR